MGSLSLRARYRPIRIGWCIESEAKDQLESALRLTHAFAGGRFNPLIPVDQSDLAESLVDRFRVDLLYPVADTPSITAFVDAHDYLPWPELEKRLFYEQWRDIPPRATIADVYHAARRVREHGKRRRKLRLVTCAADDPLATLLLAMTGDYPTPSASVPDYRPMMQAILGTHQMNLGRTQAVPARLLRTLTPSSLTTLGLEPDAVGPDHGVYVGDAQNLEDLLNYWNLQAAGSRLVFVDPAESGRLTELLEAHKRLLGSLPARPWQEDGAITVYYRAGGGEPDFSAVGANQIRHAIDVVSWNGLNIKPALRHWRQQSVLGTTDDSDRKLAVTFPLPKSPLYDNPELSHQYLAVTVHGSDPWSHAHEATFFPPYVPELNEYYGRQLYHGYSQIRAEPESIWRAVTVIVRSSESDVTLRALPISELITGLFNRFGIQANPSPAGLVTSRLIAQMGGLQACRVFKVEGVRTLIERYSPDQSFTRSNAVQTIGNFNPAANRPRFEPFEALYIAPRRHRQKLTPHDCLEYLLSRGVFRVGLELKCVHCELSFWSPLDDVKTKMDCPYCGSSFGIADKLQDRDWAYRRSGLFGRVDHQHGGIPVAVTLQQLDTLLQPGKLLYAASLELRGTTAAILPCETDFAVLATGHSYDRADLPQVVIGECKSAGGRISVEDAEHLSKVADALPPRRVSVFVLFAKTGAFSAEEIAAAARAQHRWRSRVIMLSKDELEPYHVDERTPTLRQRSLHSLEALAEYTTERYAELRPRGWDELDQLQLHRRVERRALELFEARAREDGHDWQDWFAAEAEMQRRP